MSSAIVNVILRFAFLSDERTFSELGDLVTDDFVLEFPGQERRIGPGRDELLTYVTDTAAARDSAQQVGRHLLTNILVDRAEDGSATAISYVTFLVTSNDGTTSIQGFATYRDRLVEDGGAWRLASRRIDFDRDRISLLSVP